MRRIILIVVFLVLIIAKSEATKVDTLYFGNVGKVVLYHPAKTPDAFILFVSGDGGWNKGVDVMANNIVSQGAMVAGINIVSYLKRIKSSKSKCCYPASDLETISLSIQKKYQFSKYLKPVLVGYSSGATLVYGALAQAPANTFKGAIAMGFCPDMDIDRPFCRGAGLSCKPIKAGISYMLEPCTELTAPFIALSGSNDQVCSFFEMKKYVDKIRNAEIVGLPNVGHGFAVTRNWVPQFANAYRKILNEPGYQEKKSAENVLLKLQIDSLYKSDLPLSVIPSPVKKDLPLAFFISGDGGWTSFDQAVCDKLAEKGIPVIGLDAQKYFWNKRQPRAVANELAPAIVHYLKLWNRQSFVLVGYSFGACVVPFIAENFNDQEKQLLKGVYCFSPDLTGDFEIHLSDMLHLKTTDSYNVAKGMKTIQALNPVCIFGTEEEGATRKAFSDEGIRVEMLPGNHHYSSDFNAISGVIMKDFAGDSFK
ncbi:MAG TPA: AcvB/VirJ family lysyl-phosphatidylglycerol hydrolase [Prolixibacteraceae bacterium]|nr:AcvB/VirJ family lysyl-phosphatidylglycerol hydrolase [Prolixibacteraceae bacterium]HPR84833.1 AcvB/VirJ family lysyl-phosphatidylglycerol hydrolase [Prolixibacteraceae bacterium]